MGALAYVALDIVPVRRVYEADRLVGHRPARCADPGGRRGAGDGRRCGGGRVVFSRISAAANAVFAVIVMLILTMWLTDFMNNAATAAVMAPVALGCSRNPWRHVRIRFSWPWPSGASCAFLTPIGHQNNTLILGPGGFRFGDYWRLGLPLQIIHHHRGRTDDPHGLAVMKDSMSGPAAPCDMA